MVPPAPFRALLVLGAVLAAAGMQLHFLLPRASDAPTPAAWADATALYPPWLHHGRGAALSVLAAAPDPAARMLKVLALRFDGQWDPVLLAVVGIAIAGAALAVLLTVATRSVSRAGAVLLAGAALAVFATAPTAQAALDGSLPWTALLLVLSAAHLAGTAAAPARARRRWLAQVAGLANVLTATAGIASPLAVLAWLLLGRRSGIARKEAGSPSRPNPTGSVLGEDRALVGWNLGLVCLGLYRLIRVLRAPLARVLPGALSWHTAAWPFWDAAWIPVICGPALLLLSVSPAAHARGRSALPRLLATWSLLQTAVLALPGCRPAGANPAYLLCALLVVQLLAIVELPAAGRPTWLSKPVVAAVWLILVLNGVVERARLVPPIETSLAEGRARAAAVRGFGDHSVSDPRFMAILPPSVRPPLALSLAAGTTGFHPGAAPRLDGLGPLVPIWGTWSTDDTGRAGRFESQPLRSTASMLQLFVAGRLDPPASSLELRPESGQAVRPFESAADATGRWKRLNFPTPPGPFRVVAQADARHWLAFSAPIESARLSWIAGKLPDAWAWFTAAGLLLFSGGAAAALARRLAATRHDPAARLAGAAYLPWVFLGGYGLLLSHYIDPYAAGSDASGYLNSARLLLQGRLSFPPRPVPGATGWLLTPLGYIFNARGHIVPGYPVGLPLLIAAAGRLLALTPAIKVVILIHLLAGVVFTRLLAGEAGLRRAWAWGAAAAIAFCPLYVFMGLQPMSDAPSLVWLSAALYFALRSRRQPACAFLAGLATAGAVLLRPANAICVVPLVVALGASPSRLLRWIAGGLPAAAFAAWYNARLYLSPFMTGYGDTRSAFAWAWVRPTLASYAHWLPAFFTPLIVLAAAGPFLRGLTRPARGALTVSALVYFGFYVSYCFTHDTWWYLRFVLPAFPALVILAMAAAGAGFERLTRTPLRRTGAIVVLTLAGGAAACNAFVQFSRLPVLYSGEGNRVYREAAEWLNRHAPPDAVVACFQTSGAVAYYTPLPILRCETWNAGLAGAIVRRLEAERRPIYAVVFRSDGMPPLERLAASWRPEARFGDASVWSDTSVTR